MIGPLRRKLMMTCLRERCLWPLLGAQTLGWRRFLRRLMGAGEQDLAVIRLARRPPLGFPYYVWVVFRLDRRRRRRPRLVPERIYMPDDEDVASRLGMPEELRGRPYFAPNDHLPDLADRAEAE